MPMRILVDPTHYGRETDVEYVVFLLHALSGWRPN